MLLVLICKNKYTYFEKKIITGGIIIISPNLLLIDAAERGDLEAVANALQAGADINFKDGDYQSAIMLAAIGNHVGVVQHLIKRGASVDALSPLVWDYLSALIFKKFDDAALLLLGKIQENFDQIPISAVKAEPFALRDLGGVSRIPVVQAASHGNMKILKPLLDIVIKSQGGLELQHTFISYLEKNSIDYPTIKCFLDAGVDINFPDILGNTPLFYVDSVDMAKILIDLGANIEHKNKDGLTPVEYLNFRGSNAAEYIENKIKERTKEIKSNIPIEIFGFNPF